MSANTIKMMNCALAKILGGVLPSRSSHTKNIAGTPTPPFKVALILIGLLSGLFVTSVQAQTCTLNAENEIWVNKDNRDIVRIEDINGTPTEVVVTSSFTVLGDIAFTPDGTLYGVQFSVAPAALVIIDPTMIGETPILSFPDGFTPNSLSSDGDGLLYVGGAGADDSLIYRIDPSVPSLTPWHDFGSGRPAGDFIFLNGFVYVAYDIDNNGTNVRLYEVTIDANNDFVSFVDLGQLPDYTFGLASNGMDTVYVAAFTDIYSFIPPTTPVVTVPVTHVLPTLNANYGATSQTEAAGNLDIACLHLQKTVINDGDGGTAVDADFTLSFDNSNGTSGSGAETSTAVTEVEVPTVPGQETYILSETGPASYTQTSLTCTGAADADPSDGLTLAQGERVICTFTNDDVEADIQVVKTLDTPTPYFSGDTVEYTITVTNNGPDEAVAVSVDDLSSGLSGITITAVTNPDGDAGDCAAGSSFPCPIADMANGETVSITVTGVVQ